MKKIFSYAIVLIGIFLFYQNTTAYAAGPTIISSDITVPTTWSKESSPYIIQNRIIMSAPLIIEPGTVVKFNNTGATGLAVNSIFSAIGTPEEKITFTSVCDNNYGGDTRNFSSSPIGCNFGPLRMDWGGIGIYPIASTNITIEYARILYAYRGVAYSALVQEAPYRNVSVRNSEISQCGSGVLIYNTIPVLEWNVFHDNNYGVEVVTSISSRQPIIRDSSFVNNGRAIQRNYPGNVDIDARYNWWGDPTGPYFWSADPSTANTSGLGNRIVNDRIAFRPWLESEPSGEEICAGKCASNVLFLPGLKTSKLYKNGIGPTEDQLWPPNYFGNDIQDLALDGDGKSINTVYTRDILSEILTGNIYKSFVGNLSTLKSNGTINDYNLFAYDWRKNVEDIVREGTLYPDGVTRSLVADVEALARTSKTRKVTIIAHSNGGLLAKALMIELQNRGLYFNVDTIVFAGAPQMGTPLSVLSLLYGYDEGIPTLVSRKDARTFAENMPGAYGLLPSEEYFRRITDPLITFSSERTPYKIYKDNYGDGIYDEWSLLGFLEAGNGERTKPDASDVESENIINEYLFFKAVETHSHLDAWVPPTGVQVIQIAGWGLDTISGVGYPEKEKTHCYLISGSSLVPSCVGTGEYESFYEPKFTVDGDKVVTAPSALMIPDASNVKKYWVNLYGYNDNNTQDSQHRNLLEASSVQAFLSDVITKKSDAVLPAFFSTTRPDNYNNASPRLRMSLYSPLDIHLYDDAGNHTGPKKEMIDGIEQTVFEENIPNSYYYQFGDRKYVGFGSGEHIRVEMDGYALGSYTLKLEEAKPTATGDEVTSHTTFENLPTTADTEVKFEIPSSGLVDLTSLKADVNGDKVVDYTVIPVENGVATLSQDTFPPVTTISAIGTTGTNDWYTSDVTVTLIAQDEAGGTGVEKTEYSLDNGTHWNTYADPFVLSNEGTVMVQYFSTDKQGNREETKTQTVKIDKTAPEGKIVFNSTTQKLDIIGTDNLSQNVSVTVVDSVVPSPPVHSDNKEGSKESDKKGSFEHEDDRDTRIKSVASITDEAGHVTILTLGTSKDKERRIVRTLESISYDGVVTSLSKTSLQYKWNIEKKKNVYMMLASSMRVGSKTIESHYMPKKNITIIMQKPTDLDERDEDNDFETRPVKEKLPGMVIPSMMTEKGIVKINY